MREKEYKLGHCIEIFPKLNYCYQKQYNFNNTY